MNSSFSKKRHILEVNNMLENRFIHDKILVEQAIDIYSDWGENYPCMVNKTKRQMSDNSTYYAEGSNTYFGNGRMQVKVMDGKFSMYYWYCDPSNPSNILASKNANDPVRLEAISKNLGISKGSPAISNELPGASSTAASSGDKKTLNQTLQWKDCSKTGVYQLACKDSRPKDQNDIMKIQGCIGVKQDGYFGERTMKTLNRKYPTLGGVVRVGDINTICQSQITPVGLSGDNDMDAAPGNQQEPRQVIPAQQINKAPQTQVRSNQGIPTPQLSQQTIQKAANAAQTNPTLRPK